MPEFFEIIKLISIIQFLLIVLVLLLSYAVKIYSYYDKMHQETLQKKIKKTLIDLVEQENFNIKSVQRFKHHPAIIMESIYFLDASIKHPQWQSMRAKIIDLIILPSARVYANSSSWNRRLIACKFFELSLQKKDEKLIIALMQDSIPIVSITASQLAIKVSSQKIIDAFINIFSQARRIQQSFYSQVMSTADPNITIFIKNRIRKEKNPYIKAFCYRTLMYFPPTNTVTFAPVKKDLYSKNIELTIASLAYFTYCVPLLSSSICVEFLKDKNWQVRAKAALLLGEIGDESLAPKLEASLKDPNWWVRVNAAEALASLGAKGLNILKQQKQLDSQDAYDVANQILSTK